MPPQLIEEQTMHITHNSKDIWWSIYEAIAKASIPNCIQAMILANDEKIRIKYYWDKIIGQYLLHFENILGLAPSIDISNKVLSSVHHRKSF